MIDAERSSRSAAFNDEELTCAKCGYDLRGLEPDGRCPECGLLIVDSISERRRSDLLLGPPLERQPHRWIRSTGRGFFLFIVAAILPAAAIQFIASSLWLIPFIASWLFQLIGFLLITRRTDQERMATTRSRLASRCCFLAAWTVIGITAIVETVSPGRIQTYGIFPLGYWGCSALTTVVTWVYLARLAARLRQPLLGRVCYGMAICGFALFGSIAGIIGWEPFSNWPVGPYLPDVPVLGPVDVFTAYLAHPEWIAGGWRSMGPKLPPIVWVIATSATLSRFGIIFLEMARNQQRASSNSLP